MADAKISALTAASALSGPELFAGVQGGANVKITAAQIQTLINAAPTFTGTTTPQGLLDISGASAGQIKFPATQNASANANTLDDYEEGTFTVFMAFGGGVVGQTYSAQGGEYTKIGNRVFFELEITFTNKGSSAGNAIITGLPFASGTGTTGIFAVTCLLVDLNVAGGYYTASAYSFNSATLILQERGDNVTPVALTNVDFQNTSGFSASGHYSI